MLTSVKYILWFILLLLLQRLVLDNIFILTLERPIIFYFFLLILPRMPAWGILLTGFFTGLFYDILYHTPGIHAAACVMIAFLRDGLVRLFLDDEEESEYSAHISTLGFGRFFSYVLVLSFIFHLIVTFLNQFSFKDVFSSMLMVAYNTAASVLLIYIFDIIFFYRKASTT